MTWPLVVMVGAVAIASFTTTIGGSIDRTQRARSWEAVGGDFRITTDSAALALGSLIAADERPVDADVAAGVVIDGVSAVGPIGPTFVEVTSLEVSAYLDEVTDGVDDLIDVEPARDAAGRDGQVGSVGRCADAGDRLDANWPPSTLVRVGDTFTMHARRIAANDEYEAIERVDTVAGVDPEAPLGPRRPGCAGDPPRRSGSPQPNLLVGRADPAEDVTALTEWIAPVSRRGLDQIEVRGRSTRSPATRSRPGCVAP